MGGKKLFSKFTQSFCEKQTQHEIFYCMCVMLVTWKCLHPSLSGLIYLNRLYLTEMFNKMVNMCLTFGVMQKGVCGEHFSEIRLIQVLTSRKDKILNFHIAGEGNKYISDCHYQHWQPWFRNGPNAENTKTTKHWEKVGVEKAHIYYHIQKHTFNCFPSNIL